LFGTLINSPPITGISFLVAFAGVSCFLITHFVFRTDVVRIVGFFMNHVDNSPKEELREFAHEIVRYLRLTNATGVSADCAQEAWQVRALFI
jgi:hypothetical protein